MNSESVIKWDDNSRPKWFSKWFSRIPIDEYEKLAGIGYTPQQIAMYYDVNVNDFMFYFSLLNSPLKYHYDRGLLIQTAREGISMADAAAIGENVTQAQRLDKLRNAIEFKNNVSKVFFDDLDV